MIQKCENYRKFLGSRYVIANCCQMNFRKGRHVWLVFNSIHIFNPIQTGGGTDSARGDYGR